METVADINVAKLFNLCADVYNVQKPVVIDINGTFYAVAGVRDEQGTFVIETVHPRNGKVTHEITPPDSRLQ